jgi:hypothetical protein
LSSAVLLLRNLEVYPQLAVNISPSHIKPASEAILASVRIMSSIGVTFTPKMFANLILLLSSLQFVYSFESQRFLSESAGPLDSKFAALVNKTLHSWHVPGLSIAVIDGDDVWAEVRQNRPHSLGCKTHQSALNFQVPTIKLTLNSRVMGLHPSPTRP